MLDERRQRRAAALGLALRLFQQSFLESDRGSHMSEHIKGMSICLHGRPPAGDGLFVEDNVVKIQLPRIRNPGPAIN